MIGPAGFGKTTLVDWVAGFAKEQVPGIRVVRVACFASHEPSGDEPTEPPTLRSLIDVPSGTRLVPDDRAYVVFAEILRQLGKPPARVEEEPATHRLAAYIAQHEELHRNYLFSVCATMVDGVGAWGTSQRQLGRNQ